MSHDTWKSHDTASYNSSADDKGVSPGSSHAPFPAKRIIIWRTGHERVLTPSVDQMEPRAGPELELEPPQFREPLPVREPQVLDSQPELLVPNEEVQVREQLQELD